MEAIVESSSGSGSSVGTDVGKRGEERGMLLFVIMIRVLYPIQ